MAKKSAISAKSMNGVSKDIRIRRDSVNSICREFQAVWSKVYPDEFREAQKCAIAKAQEATALAKELGTVEAKCAETEAKNARYSLELVASMRKSMQLSEGTIALVQEIHEGGITFAKISIEAIEAGLAGLKYINDEGLLCEKKKNKETQEIEFVPIQKWTVAKFGRFLRLANIEVPTI